MTRHPLAALAALVAGLVLASAAPVADEVTSLPGWDDKFRSRWFSGYVPGSQADRAMHYLLVESEGSATDPVVLWLNGGPGCSSLIGFWLEQGPLSMGGDGLLTENDSRWSKNAHVLFIESPPGVGFSYVKGAAPPYVANDTSTAADNLAALAGVFALFPELKANSLWLSGESYSGVYVPMLAATVLAHPELGLNLKGVLVGNGAVATGDWYEGGLVQQRMQHAYNPGLFSTPLTAQIDTTCGTNWTSRSSACNALLDTMSAQVGPLNAYDIEVTCLGGGASPQQRALVASAGGGDVGANACGVADAAVTIFMNDATVQAALHVSAGAAALGSWGECQSGTVSYTREPQDERATVYPGLIAKIAVLIYNGDQDECIPYLQDQEWTRAMGYAVKEEWRPWLLDEQVAGYVVEFVAPVRFTFITVKRAGHEVPMYQPERALAMLQRFVAGSPF